jgi:predicted Zn finger-like uncharacterized protein
MANGQAMHVVCPSCDTAFVVDPAALGTAGRSVRCTRCGTTWFATPPDDAPGEVIADAIGGAQQRSSSKALVARRDMLPWQDAVVIDVADGPPLVPGYLNGVQTIETAPDINHTGVRRASNGSRRAAKRPRGRTRLVSVTVILAAVVAGAIAARSNLVRAVPDLAGLYAAAGLPVNLRGLEFSAVKTTREMHDGIPVLVVEGEVVNVTSRPVELPRLRLAVLGAGNRELYAWSAPLPRAILSDGERISFRNRLASPPADGREVLVRFQNREDMSSVMR